MAAIMGLMATEAGARAMIARQEREFNEAAERYSEAYRDAYERGRSDDIDRLSNAAEECGAVKVAHALECKLWNIYSMLDAGHVRQAKREIIRVLFDPEDEEAC